MSSVVFHLSLGVRKWGHHMPSPIALHAECHKKHLVMGARGRVGLCAECSARWLRRRACLHAHRGDFLFAMRVPLHLLTRALLEGPTNAQLHRASS